MLTVRKHSVNVSVKVSRSSKSCLREGGPESKNRDYVIWTCSLTYINGIRRDKPPLVAGCAETRGVYRESGKSKIWPKC